MQAVVKANVLVDYIDEMPYATIIDSITTPGTTYICEAYPGTLSSAAKWRIQKLVSATGVITFADGNAAFDNIADNRAALAYS